MSTRILLIEDEHGMVLTLSDLLASHGFEFESVSDGESGLARAATGEFDLIILDIILPKKTGLDVCRELRQSGVDTAILMLTAKTHVTDRVLGLRLGADDYLTKPFEPDELLARLEALLRRARKSSSGLAKIFKFDDVEIDFERAEVRKSGLPVNLAAKELRLLRYLVDHRNKVISREEILHEVWEYNAEISSRTVDVHIAWLRHKLEDNPQEPKHLKTIRNQGYLFIG